MALSAQLRSIVVCLVSSDSVLHVRFPNEFVRLETEQLDVSVVVSAHDRALRVVEAVAEAHAPAVARSLPGSGLQRRHGLFLTHIPHLHTACQQQTQSQQIEMKWVSAGFANALYSFAAHSSLVSGCSARVLFEYATIS